MTARRAAAAGLLAAIAGCAQGPPAHVEEFAEPASLDSLSYSDASAWTWSDADGGALSLKGASDYAPPHRSPRSIALLPVSVDDFVMEVECLQTGRNSGHRDLCLFFGYVDPSTFHYVHLAPSPDPHAHNVFVVDGAPRKALLPVNEEGIDWGEDEWHTLRLERRGPTVTVSFDDEVVLEGSSDTFRAGRVGVGSFDDTGLFRRVVVTPR